MLLGWSVPFNNIYLIIHLRAEYFMIFFYQLSITEPFSLLTMSAQSTFDQNIFSAGWATFWELNMQAAEAKAGRGIKFTPLLFLLFAAGQMKRPRWFIFLSDLTQEIRQNTFSLPQCTHTRCLPPRELQHVNYICYQPRWWLICYFCLLTMTSW